MLERYQLAPDKADIGRELRVLRCLLLLIQLTGCSQPPFLKTCLSSTSARNLCHRRSRSFALQSDIVMQRIKGDGPKQRQLTLPS